MKRLLLIGGGIAHAELLAGMAAASTRNADVTLVHPRRRMVFAPMVPGLAAGLYGRADCEVDLGALARRIRARFVEETIVGLDPQARLATTESGQRIEFDFASIDAATTSASPEVPGMRENALLARPEEVFIEGLERIVELMRDGSLRKVAFVGGSASAVQLWLAAHHRLAREIGASAISAFGFSLVVPGARLAEELPEAVSAAFEAACLERGISLLRGAAPTAVTRETVQLANGVRLASDVTLWALGNTPPRWLQGAGLACDEAGFLKVDAQLRCVSHGHVFAAGDCARLADVPATDDPALVAHQAQLLRTNVLAALAAQPPATWAAPPKVPRWFSLGGREAVALRDGRLVESARWWQWRRKDRADRIKIMRYQVK